MRSVSPSSLLAAALLAAVLAMPLPARADALGDLVVRIEDALAAQDPRAAEPLAREALARALTEHGPQSAEAANLHRLLGDSLYSQDRFEDAETEFRAAYDLRRQLLTAPDIDLAISTNDLAIVLRRLGRADEAEPLYRDVAAQRLALFGPDHPNAARAQFWVARIIDAQSRFGEAAAAMAEAVALARRSFGAADPTTIDWMWEYAAMLHDAGDPAAAAAYLAVIDTGTPVLPADDATLASARHGLGNFYYQNGRAAEAIPLLRDALATREATLGPNDEATLFTVDRLARSLWQVENIAEADALFQRLLAAREAAGETDTARIADLLRWIGRAASSENRRADAERAYKRALAISEIALGPDHVLTAFDLLALGQLYSGQQRLSEARPLLARAVDILEVSDETRSSASVARMALSFLEFADGNAALAASLAERALVETIELRGETSREAADIMLTLAGYWEQSGNQPDRVEPMITAARAIYSAVAPDSRAALRATSELGRLRQRQGRIDEALALHSTVLAALISRYGADATQIQPALADLGDTSFQLGDYQSAAAFYERTTAITEQLSAIDAAATFATRIGDVEDQAIARAATFDHLVMAYDRLAQADPDAAGSLAASAFRVAQRVTESRAASALAQMAARQASGSGELAALVRERQDAAADWQRNDDLLTAALGDGDGAATEAQRLRSALAAIDTRIAEIDATLATNFPAFASLQRPAPMSVGDVQTALGDDDVLLYFADTSRLGDTPAATYLWVISRSGPIIWRRLPLATVEIAAAVRELRASMGVGAETRGPTALAGPRDNATRLLTAAVNLHETLLGDVADVIAGKSLIIVPSRSLSPLPFSALATELPAADAPDRFAIAHWLVRDHAVTILPSVASLAAATAPPDSGDREPYLAFANPLLSGASGDDRRAFARTSCMPVSAPAAPAAFEPMPEASALFRGGAADTDAVRRLAPLPETTDEVCAIADVLGADEGALRLGAAATETSLQSLSLDGTLARTQIVHFATHGLVSGELSGLAEPAIVLTPPEGATGPEGDDGLLTASEVTLLRLDADWVILSACNTASSDGGGEALSGLARAFFYAGAHSLMVSHWPVNSGAAVRLATTAVSAHNADSSISRAEALRRAMLAEIARGGTDAEPSNWAPFVIVGAR